MRSKRVLGLFVLAAALAATAGLALATVRVTTKGSANAKTIVIEGSGGNDDVTIEVIPGVTNPSQKFFEIQDPKGIPGAVPSGCFRFDANTIHCPVKTTAGFEIDLKGGDDTLEFGAGIVDEAEVDAGSGDDEIDSGGGNDKLDGGPGDDDIDGGDGNDERSGGTGDDFLRPSAGNDIQNGGKGRDKIVGGAGDDKQFGGPGKDNLVGNGGKDQQFGGPGNDSCDGGGGSNTQKSC